MNTYITAPTIKALREQKKLTQAQLADQLSVSHKTISKWETGKGLPDISLLEPLAKALGVSLPELFSGQPTTNANRSANLLRSKLYVCPVCGNILHGSGAATISCCGVMLPALEAEPADETHMLRVEHIGDELFLSVQHSMTKEHYISFLAYCTDDRFLLRKLYPEGNAETPVDREPCIGTVISMVCFLKRSKKKLLPCRQLTGQEFYLCIYVKCIYLTVLDEYNRQYRDARRCCSPCHYQ